MSLFEEMQKRQLQKKANNFIRSLDKLSDKEIEQAYLDNKEFENNEIVLSYLFFKLPSIIRILPIDFQISRLNSNLNMFDYGSVEARKKLISSWLSDNKFFTNANAINLTEAQVNSYLVLYFKQPEDVAKLHMVDLKRVIEVLIDVDIKETENIIVKIKSDLTDRQWEYVIDACPMFIKYASQEIQNKYADDDRFNKFINGEARDKFVKKQMELIKDDISLLSKVPIDVQAEYINKYPYMINISGRDAYAPMVVAASYNEKYLKEIYKESIGTKFANIFFMCLIFKQIGGRKSSRHHYWGRHFFRLISMKNPSGTR